MKPWLLSLLIAIGRALLKIAYARGEAEGVTAEQQREKQATDTLGKIDDEIADAPLPVDTAIERLRARAARDDGH